MWRYNIHDGLVTLQNQTKPSTKSILQESIKCFTITILCEETFIELPLMYQVN